MKKIYFLGGALLLPFILLSETIPYQEGFPIEIDPPSSRCVIIADVDNDNKKDLILQGRGDNLQEAMLYVFDYLGSVKNGFPISGGKFFVGLPPLFDKDDDGKFEIILTMYGSLYLIDYNGSIIWQIDYNGPIFQSKYYVYFAAIDDLDNDGTKEIVVTTYSGGAIFVFEPNGSVREGWPIIIPPRPGYTPPIFIIQLQLEILIRMD